MSNKLVFSNNFVYCSLFLMASEENTVTEDDVVREFKFIGLDLTDDSLARCMSLLLFFFYLLAVCYFSLPLKHVAQGCFYKIYHVCCLCLFFLICVYFYLKYSAPYVH
jgi:hypothetical protein